MLSSPPPDFRYVGLWPSPSLRRVRLRAAAIGAATFGFGALVGGVEALTVVLAGAAGVASALLFNRRSGPTWEGSGDQAPMAIVPWGVVVRSDAALRVLRWPAIRALRVDFVHEMDHATPSTSWSVVTIRTDREVLGGRAPGYLPLEGLEARFEEYAAEASRPLALDLEGRDPLESVGEPCVEALIQRSRHLLRSGALAGDLALAAQGYRGHYGVSSRALERLRALLQSEPERADPRALAVIIASELRARELGKDVCALALSPNPVLAAVSRAAALRLGAEISRVGALDELEDFLPTVDLDVLSAWLASPVPGMRGVQAA